MYSKPMTICGTMDQLGASRRSYRAVPAGPISENPELDNFTLETLLSARGGS